MYNGEVCQRIRGRIKKILYTKNNKFKCVMRNRRLLRMNVTDMHDVKLLTRDKYLYRLKNEQRLVNSK